MTVYIISSKVKGTNQEWQHITHNSEYKAKKAYDRLRAMPDLNVAFNQIQITIPEN